MTQATTATTTPPARSAPGPRGRFLVGNAIDIQRDPLQFFLGLAHTYGDIVQFRFMNQSAFFINHPDGVKRIFYALMSFVGLFPAMVLLVGVGANGVVNLQRVMSRLSGALITIRAASFAVLAVRRFVRSLPTLLRLRPAESGQPVYLTIECLFA